MKPPLSPPEPTSVKTLSPSPPVPHRGRPSSDALRSATFENPLIHHRQPPCRLPQVDRHLPSPMTSPSLSPSARSPPPSSGTSTRSHRRLLPRLYHHAALKPTHKAISTRGLPSTPVLLSSPPIGPAGSPFALLSSLTPNPKPCERTPPISSAPFLLPHGLALPSVLLHLRSSPAPFLARRNQRFLINLLSGKGRISGGTCGQRPMVEDALDRLLH